MRKILLILLILSSACSESSGDWRNPNSLEQSVLVIPDSILTKEQKTLKSSIEKMMIEKSVVKENRLILNVEKSYLPTVGIGEGYYKILLKQHDETNNTYKKLIKDNPNFVFDLDKMLDDAKKEYSNKNIQLY